MPQSHRLNILLCVSTAFEASLLRERAGTRSNVRIVETGVGPVNAAHGVTLAIALEPPDAIVSCGIGGAYPSSGLRVGDVVCAGEEVYGDLGAQSPDGFLDMKALGFPVITSTPPLFNVLPLQLFPSPRRGRFVTVSTVTGTDDAAGEIERRTGGAVESMEGAAIVHVARLHGIDVGELRGISNMVGPRDRNSWRLKEAAEAAQLATLDWLEKLNL